VKVETLDEASPIVMLKPRILVSEVVAGCVEVDICENIEHDAWVDVLSSDVNVAGIVTNVSSDIRVEDH